MSLFERLSHSFSAAKKAWSEPRIEEKQEAIFEAMQPAPANPYYYDTISNANEELPQIQVVTLPMGRGRIEYQLEQASNDMDAYLAREERDFEKLLPMIHQVIMLSMRDAAKSDQDHIFEVNFKIKKQANEIRDTYHKDWQGLSITVISATLGFAAGACGLATFYPATFIAVETGKNLVAASSGIGSASSSTSGLGQIFTSRRDGTLQVLQIHLKDWQDIQDERRGSKNYKIELLKSAKSAADEATRTWHEARRTTLSY